MCAFRLTGLGLGLGWAWLAACAHAPDLPLRPDPAPPAGSTTETFTARDGTQLLERIWKPAGEPKAVVVVMHGLKDYSARYADLATQLTAAGYAVYAFDMRGHGRSAGPRVAPADWQDYVDDLDRFLTAVEHREPGKRVFLFGHSMGGAVATLAAERHTPELAGLLLTGPALVADVPPILLAVTRMSGALTPKAPALSLDNTKFSTDPTLAARMDHDDMIQNSAAPARTAAGLIDGMRQIWAGTAALTMPILAMHATDDELTAPWGSRELLVRAPATDKTLRIFEGQRHDLLHDDAPTRKAVADTIQAWLDARIAPPAPPPPPPPPHTPVAAIGAIAGGLANLRLAGPDVLAQYPGHLSGGPHGWTQAVEAAVGASRAGSATQVTGEVAIEIARPEPIGYHAAFDARMTGGVYRTLALRPVGLAVRAGAAVIGVSGGAAIVTDAKLAISAGGWLELPLGPVHLGGSAEWSRLFSDSAGAAPLGADLLWLGGSLRLGGDRAYWPGAHAGVGPVASAGGEWVGARSGAFVMLGLQLYGAD